MADGFTDQYDDILDEANTTPESEVVEEALKLFERDRSNWSSVYQKALEDLEFQSDKPYAQWDDATYSDRKQTGRPVITLDQLGQFVHQVVNDIRQNTPSINAIPAGEASDPETADIVKGLIKGIEYQSSADDAYDTAATFSVKSSIGFIRVDHDYANDTGFEQALCIKRVINPLACYIDSNSVEADGKDAKHAHVLEDMTVGAFKDRWPGFDAVNFSAKKERRGKTNESDMITVCEFFQLEEEEKEISLDEDGSIVMDGEDGEEKPEPKAKRKVKRVKVKRYWLSGKDVLEQSSFPGKYIPVVPVYGEEAWLDGERNLFSLIRKAKDGQMMFNLWASLETELLLKQPQAPVMVPAGAIEAYSADWKSPSKSMALRYDQVSTDGSVTYNKPERLQPPTIPTGIVNAKQESLNDIKATLGMYNASVGERSNAISGVAYNAQKKEGDVATYHFADNLARSIEHVGRIIVSAIPEIYDTPRIIRIIGAEDEPQMVGINGAPMQEGQERPFDLRSAEYDVRVVTGPSYTTKRQETVAALNQLFQAQPQLMQVFGDIYFKNSDFAGAEAMAARAEKLLPPNLKDDNSQQDPQVMQLQQALQAAQVQIQQLTAEVQNKQDETQLKAAELQFKQQELGVKSKEIEQKGFESQTKAHLENKKLDVEMHNKRMDTKAAVQPDVAMSDPEMQPEGQVPPMLQMVAQMTQAIQASATAQAAAIQQGLGQLAQAQAATAQVTAQGDAAIARALLKPKSVQYDKNGNIVGVA